MRPRLAAALLCFAGHAALAQSASCPAHSAAYRVEQSPTLTVIHCRCDSGYYISGGACVLPPPPPPGLSCAVARARVAADLAEFAKERKLALENAVQLEEWQKLGKEGRNGLMMAGIKFAVGTYAAQEIVAGKHLDDLEEATNALENNAYSLQKLNQVKAELTAEGIPLDKLIPRLAAQRALDASDSWSLSKGAMHDAFAAAAKTDAQLANELNTPQFRDSLIAPSDDEDTKEHIGDVLSTIFGELVSMRDMAGDYVDITVPAVNAGSFIVDSAYAGLQLWYASHGAAQANQTDTQLARAVGLMRAKYGRDLTDEQTCTP